MADSNLHTIKWTDTEELRIGVNDFKGKQYLALRIWYTDDSGTMRPGKQGINVPMDRADEFFEVIAKGKEALDKKGKKKGGK